MSIERADAAVKREDHGIPGSRNMSFSQIYRKYGTLLIFAGICILASILSPTFLTEANLTGASLTGANLTGANPRSRSTQTR